MMKRVVARERNKNYYRMLHLPIWLWVFFILPGHLTHDFYRHGPDRRHAWWFAAVAAVCLWRAFAGRLPGVEPRPYITHYGEDKPNLAYRVVCYTAAWIDLTVPFTLNLVGLAWGSVTGSWIVFDNYGLLYYVCAAGVVAATAADCTPRARRSTYSEGAERAWFYCAVWVVVPAQVALLAAWRLGGKLGLASIPLGRLRLAVFLLVAGIFGRLALGGRLPRTERYHVEAGRLMAAAGE